MAVEKLLVREDRVEIHDLLDGELAPKMRWQMDSSEWDSRLAEATRVVVNIMNRPYYEDDLTPKERQAAEVGYVEAYSEAYGSPPQLTDAQAVDTVAEMLRDPDWGVGMLEDIADVCTRAGRDLSNPNEEPTWDRH